MPHKSLALFLLIGGFLLAGCATPYGLGQTALRYGRYDEAASYFEEVLARDPDRLDALVGLGVSRFKAEEFDEAIDALDRVVARAPEHVEARLYLGLSYLQKGEDGLAEDQLGVLLGLKPEPRLAAQLDRILKVIRLEPLSEEMRRVLTASLEDEAEWAREVRELKLTLRDSERRLLEERLLFRRGVIFFAPRKHRR